MAYSTLHQQNPSPYTTKCYNSCFSEPSMLANNGGCPPLLGLEDNYTPSFDTAKVLNEDLDFIDPETSPDTNLVSYDDYHHHPLGHGSGLEPIPALPEYYNVVDYLSSGGGLDGLLGFNTPGYQQMDSADIGEQPNVVGINGYTSAPAYHVAFNGGIWQGIQSKKIHVENINTRVGRYSVEERRDRIHRYLKKRNQRNFNKTIKYACRKTLADRRARVRGRFAKNNEEAPADDQFKPNKISDGMPNSPYSYYDYAKHDHQTQTKEEGEEWLQEAIASLMMYNMASPYQYHHLPQQYWQAPAGSLPLH